MPPTWYQHGWQQGRWRVSPSIYLSIWDLFSHLIYSAWLDQLFIAVDANFRLKQLNASSDTQDPGLNAGYTYFVENSAFQKYLQTYGDKLPEEMNTCNNHDTIKLAQLQGKGTSVSGVGAVVCACHDMRRGLSVADLQKGEAYINMDYAVLSTLRLGAPWQLVISYDITCQWTVNFWEHVSVYGPDFAPPQLPENVIGLVPKFHLPAHILECQQIFLSITLPTWLGRMGKPQNAVGFVPTWWPVVPKKWLQVLTKTCWMTIGETTTGGKWYPFVCIFFLRQVQKTDLHIT